MSDEIPFLFPVTMKQLHDMLRSESRSKGFSDSAVRISLMLDVNAGRIKSQRSYAQIWGWSRSKVRHHWDGIWQDVTLQIVSYGRQIRGNPLAEKLPEEWLKWAKINNPLMAHQRATQQPKNTPNSDDMADQQPSHGPPSSPPMAHHTNNPESSNPLTPSHSARGRASPPPDFDLSLTAYEIYKQTPGAKPSVMWQSLINEKVGDSPERKRVWAEVCLIWATSEKAGGGRYNTANVREMIKHFERAIAEENEPDTHGYSFPNGRSRKSKDIDPAEAYQRIAAAAASAWADDD